MSASSPGSTRLRGAGPGFALLVALVLVLGSIGGIALLIRDANCEGRDCPSASPRTHLWSDRLSVAGAARSARFDEDYSVVALYLYPAGQDPLTSVSAPGVRFDGEVPHDSGDYILLGSRTRPTPRSPAAL